jgi:hypothetical protein
MVIYLFKSAIISTLPNSIEAMVNNFTLPWFCEKTLSLFGIPLPSIVPGVHGWKFFRE